MFQRRYLGACLLFGMLALVFIMLSSGASATTGSDDLDTITVQAISGDTGAEIATAAEPTADLTITDHYLEDICGDEVDDATSGHPTCAFIMVENTGDLDASSFTVQMYVDDVPFYQWTVSSLCAGETELLRSPTFSYSGIGEHNITIIVDNDGTVTELDETNNERYWEFEIINAKYTFLIYLCGDNNLEFYHVENFLEMAEVGSNAEVTVLLQFDRISDAELGPGYDGYYYDSRYGDWYDCMRFYITEGMTPTVTNATMDLGEVNMGDAGVLEDFLLWGIENYSADNYIVSLKDHGSSWYGICGDWTSPGSDILKMDEMSSALSAMALETGKPIDILLLDACLMGSIEVVAELDGLALYMVGSETVGYTCNLYYDDLLNYIQNNLDDTKEQMAITIAQMQDILDSPVIYLTQCVAAYNITLTSDLMSAFDAYIDDLYVCWSDDPRGMQSARADADYEIFLMYVDCHDLIDLYQFAELTMGYYQDDGLNTSGHELLQLLDADSISPFVLTYKYTDTASFCHGLSIYFPSTTDTYHSRYLSEATALLDGSDWDELLLAYLAESPPQTTVVLDGTKGNDGWYRTSVIVLFSVYDPSSLGHSYLNYSINGVQWTTYDGAFAITDDGTYVITFYATGENGAVEEIQSVTMKMDRTNPTVSCSLDGSNITLSTIDATSGAGAVLYRVDGGAWNAYSDTFTVKDGWEHAIQYYAIDAAGNTGMRGEVTIGDDDTSAPDTSVDVDGTSGNDSWYVSSVSIALSAEDGGGSGLSVIYYNIYDAWATYNGTFWLNATGTYTLSYYSTDNFGNVEGTHSLPINIDLEAPEVQTSMIGTGEDDAFNGTVTVTLIAEDGASGVDRISYRLNGGAWTTYSTPLSYNESGTYHIECRSVDGAGNFGTVTDETFTIDLVSTTSASSAGWQIYLIIGIAIVSLIVVAIAIVLRGRK